MNKADHRQDQDSIFSMDRLVSFIEALNRMFKIGIYYPAGHIVLDKSANKCIQHLREISPSLNSVRIVMERNRLLVEKWELPEASVPVKELHQFLSSLGLKTIEFQRSIEHKQLLNFIKILLDWRMQVESVQSFISFNVSDLPDSTRVEQQEFLVDETLIQNLESVDDYQRNLQQLFSSLAEQGLNEQQVQQCKELLEKLSKRQEEVEIDIKDFPNATWYDVETLLFKTVTGRCSPDKGRFESVATHDINALTSIFESLEGSLNDKSSKETIELLITHLKGGGTEQSENPKKDIPPAKKRQQPGQSREMVSVEDVKNFIFENIIPLKVLEKITSVDRSEEISILFQLHNSDLDEQVLGAIKQRLELILITRLSAREKGVILAGIKHFADLGDVKHFQRIFVMMLRILRHSEYFGSLDFIIDIWSMLPSTMYGVLWPNVVNELLLVGLGERKGAFFKVAEIASRMHIDGMHNLRFQLEELEAFQEGTVAPVIFLPSYIYSYRLLAVLLETSLGNIIAEKVLAALLEAPQDPLIESVGPLLDLTVVSHFQFLSSYLNHAHIESPPLALKMAAGEIVLAFLQNISEEEKGLPWISKTIASTSEMHAKGMKEMLERIVKEKKMGVVPSWPKSCRKVAESALNVFDRLSLKNLL